MSENFEELDYSCTHLGTLILRRRRDLLLDTEVYEVKLNDDFLMSSLFTVAEEELARSCLAGFECEKLVVLIGGLGLGYTARAALEQENVGNVTIIEALPEVIEWHRKGLVPMGRQLDKDARCHFVHGDFFRFISSRGQKIHTDIPDHLFHAVLLDIDHSPRLLLHPDHASFYQSEGLKQLGARLHTGGVFGMWSNEPPDDDFLGVLSDVFETVAAKTVRFPNPYQEKEASATIYIARKEDRGNLIL